MRNIVLVTIDSLRPDFTSVYNNHEKTTPFLKKLSRHSIIYKNVIAPGVPTIFCFPSIMTGRLPFDFGYFLGPQRHVPTIAELLKRKGFRTYAVISNNPVLYPIYGYNRGFDIYKYRRQKLRMRNTKKATNIVYRLKKRAIRDIIRNSKYNNRMSNLIASFIAIQRTIRTPSIKMNAEYVTRYAIELLKKRRSEPFFIWIHYMDVHAPYFSGLNGMLRRNKFLDYYLKYRFHSNIMKCINKMKIENEYIQEIVKAVYRRAIMYVDEKLEILYNFIVNEYPETMFIVTSDHGESFMEHDYYFHGPFHLYDELIRVPLIISVPDGKRAIVDRNVSIISIPKTIAAFAGIKTNYLGVNLINDQLEKISSHSLRDEPFNLRVNHITETLYGCRTPRARRIILNSKTELKGFYPMFSFRTEHYKYIINFKTGTEELYDLRKDPCEKKNLISENIPNDLLDFLQIARRTISLLIEKRQKYRKVTKKIEGIKKALKN